VAVHHAGRNNIREDVTVVRKTANDYSPNPSKDLILPERDAVDEIAERYIGSVVPKAVRHDPWRAVVVQYEFRSVFTFAVVRFTVTPRLTDGVIDLVND
jgi:hypothetical protein